jgi:hypothetical protein
VKSTYNTVTYMDQATFDFTTTTTALLPVDLEILMSDGHYSFADQHRSSTQSNEIQGEDQGKQSILSPVESDACPAIRFTSHLVYLDSPVYHRRPHYSKPAPPNPL